MKHVLCLLALTASSALTRAQVSQSWASVFDSGTGTAEIGGPIATSLDGKVYVTGSIDPAGAPSFDYNVLTLAYDAAGNLLWSRIEPAPGKEAGSAIAVDPNDGSVYVAASAGFGNQSNIRVFKYASNGTPQWTSATFDTGGDDWVSTPRAFLDVFGNLYLGATSGPGLTSTDMLVLSYSPTGALRWATPIAGLSGVGDGLMSIAVDPLGDVYVTGYADQPQAGSCKVATAHISSSGVLAWLQTLDLLPGETQIGRAVARDAGTGDVLVAATGSLPPSGPFSSWVLRYTPGGVLAATTPIPGASVSLADLQADAVGNAVLVGTGIVGSTPNILVARIAPAGTILWQYSFNQAPGYGERLAIDAAGEITVAGWVYTPGPGPLIDDEFIALRYDPAGNLRWSWRVTSTGARTEYLRGLALTPSGEVVIAGSSQAHLGAPPLQLAPSDVLTVRLRPQSDPFCFGDTISGQCPCGFNAPPLSQLGCPNSLGQHGRLADTGLASLGADTLVLAASGELPTALSIFLQGDAPTSPTAFGDGLRCVGGNLKRLYVKNAVGGVAVAPQAGDASVSARSVALGDPIAPDGVRYVQTYYRDSNLGFCAPPQGSSFNITSGIVVRWIQ